MKRVNTWPRALLIALVVLVCILIVFLPIILMKKINYTFILFEPAASLAAFAFGQWAVDKILDNKRERE